MEIEKGIPLPDRVGRKLKYPFDAMDKGDSFFAEGAESQSIANLAWAFGKSHGCKFVTRRAEKNGVSGVRVWRYE